MYKLEFYVPETHLEIVKNALFNCGAGKIGDYEQCCWQIEGEGQFRPVKGSNPHIGDPGKLEKLKEWKVEMVCSDPVMNTARDVLLETHPYEEPAYNIIKINDKAMFL